VNVTWEYLFRTHTEMASESAIEWPGETGLDVVKRGVSKLGLDGWELASVLPDPGTSGEATWIFKRPAGEGESEGGLGWTGQPEVSAG
jgi:hypothetical protein